MADACSRRVLRSSHVRLTSLTDDLQALVFGFLPTRDLLRSAIVCRLWRNILRRAGPATFEGALWELDPVGVLGPTGVAAALKAGVNTLDLLHRLGNSACGQCKRRGALFFDTACSKRVCNKCPLRRGSSPATCLPLFNRYFFVYPSEKAAIKVSTAEELRTAVDNLKTDIDERYLNTIVLTKDIDMSASAVENNPLVVGPTMRLCGEHAGICLENRVGPALMCLNAVVENLQLVSGVRWHDMPYYDGDDLFNGPFFPCLELINIESIGVGGKLVLRNCAVTSYQGSAAMNDSGRVSIDRCVMSSYMYYGLINKTTAEITNPPFLASVRSCTFRQNMWHISAGNDLSVADEAALRAAGNTFCKSEFCTSERDYICSNNKEFAKGVVQPWRRGALAAAVRASVLHKDASG